MQDGLKGRIVERYNDPRLGELVLTRRGEHYEITFNGVFLMATHGGTSEREMVRLVLAEICGERPRLGLRLLVGGLGVGFSLQEALGSSAVERVVVVEVAPQIVAWNKRYFGRYNGQALTDPRTELILDDINSYLEGCPPDSYDGIILDIDNGPDWLVLASNHRLYTESGLLRIWQTLRPGGCLVLWSLTKNTALEEQLTLVFSAYRELMVDDVRLYLARKQDNNCRKAGG